MISIVRFMISIMGFTIFVLGFIIPIVGFIIPILGFMRLARTFHYFAFLYIFFNANSLAEQRIKAAEDRQEQAFSKSPGNSWNERCTRKKACKNTHHFSRFTEKVVYSKTYCVEGDSFRNTPPPFPLHTSNPTFGEYVNRLGLCDCRSSSQK